MRSILLEVLILHFLGVFVLGFVFFSLERIREIILMKLLKNQTLRNLQCLIHGRRVRVYSFSHLWDFSLRRWAVCPDMHKTVLKLYNFVNAMATLLPLQIFVLAAQVLSQHVCRPCWNQDCTLLYTRLIVVSLTGF